MFTNLVFDIVFIPDCVRKTDKKCTFVDGNRGVRIEHVYSSKYCKNGCVKNVFSFQEKYKENLLEEH